MPKIAIGITGLKNPIGDPLRSFPSEIVRESEDLLRAIEISPRIT